MKLRVLPVTGLLFAFAGCAADAGSAGGDDPAIDEAEEASGVSSAATAAAACASFTGTLDAHVAAGRAWVETTQFFIFTIKTYHALSSTEEVLGTNGAAQVTLYRSVDGGFTAMQAKCSSCGNGVVEAPEQCDGADLAGNTCASRGYPGGGAMGCTMDCNYDTSACRTSNCGDGHIDNGEACDGTDLGDHATCQELLYGSIGGVVACRSNCDYDTSGCISSCGNGIADFGEQCDGTSRSAEFTGKSCKDFAYPDATWPWNTHVNYGSGELTCSSCTLSFEACKPAPGCYLKYPPRPGAIPPLLLCY
jgi:hypothetical protein